MTEFQSYDSHGGGACTPAEAIAAIARSVVAGIDMTLDYLREADADKPGLVKSAGTIHDDETYETYRRMFTIPIILRQADAHGANLDALPLDTAKTLKHVRDFSMAYGYRDDDAERRVWYDIRVEVIR